MITSTANQQMKNITSLLKKAKERSAQKAFVVEGPRMCFEAPVSWIRAVYVSESFLEDPDMVAQLDNRKMEYEVVSDSVFATVSETKNPKGIMAVVDMPSYEMEDLLRNGDAHLLVLESVQDPGNLGTMMRTAEGAGVTGIIMNKTTVDLFNPKTIRSTMGSLYRMPYVIAEDLAELIMHLKEQGVQIYAAHLKGQACYDQPDYTSSCAFLIGNEGNGLSDEIAGLADTYIKIPMEGQLESLNAAMSAGILMYECNRQRRTRT